MIPDVHDISEALWQESQRFGVRLTADEQVAIAKAIRSHARRIPTAASITAAFRLVGLHAPRGYGIAVRDRLDRLHPESTKEAEQALNALEREVRRQARNGAPGLDPMAGLNRRALDALFARLRAALATPDNAGRSLRDAVEASMNDIGLGTPERLDRAASRIEAALTPLQREVEPAPACSRCNRPLSALGEMYRCAQCHALFDWSCINEHFNWSVNGRSHAPDTSGDRP